VSTNELNGKYRKLDPNYERDRDEGYTLLHFASELGIVDDVVSIIQDIIREAINTRTHRLDSSPLYLAAGKGHYAVVKILVESGASLNIINDDGWTPLHVSAYEGYYAIVRYLLENGANKNARTYGGETAKDIVTIRLEHISDEESKQNLSKVLDCL